VKREALIRNAGRRNAAARRAGALLAVLWCLTGILAVIRIAAGDGGYLAREMLRFAPPEKTGLPAAEYPAVGEMTAGYLTGRTEIFQYYRAADGGERIPCFHDYEAAHMADCRGLIRLDSWALAAAGAAALAATGFALYRYRREEALYRGMLTGLRILFAGLGALLISALADFDGLFITFHRVAFTNDGWLLDPRTDLLIRLMPTEFFIALGIRGACRALAVPAALDVAARLMIGRTRSNKKE